jgi:hypothetical protein
VFSVDSSTHRVCRCGDVISLPFGSASEGGINEEGTSDLPFEVCDWCCLEYLRRQQLANCALHFMTLPVRDPREHHAPCGCLHRCNDVEVLGRRSRDSAMQHVVDVSNSAKLEGAIFALGIADSLMAAFGSGCISSAEKKACLRCWLHNLRN